MAAVTIIGIGDNGCVGMSSKAYNCIQKAQVLVGGDRHLEFFCDFKGRTYSFQEGLISTIDNILKESMENNVVVLASGDPLFYGVGDLLSKKIGMKHIEIIPTCSSIQLAFSKIGKKWDDAKVVSLHGREIKGLANKIKDEHKVFLLTDSVNTPSEIGKYLLEFNQDDWKITICENLEGQDERISHYNINDLTQDFSDLNVMILIRDKKSVKKRKITAHTEEQFEKRMPKKGLITKREIRGIALLNLEIQEDSIIWDIGAGSGSVSVEAALIAKTGKVFAIETDGLGIEICQENIKKFNTDNVEVIHTKAPNGLAELPRPDRIFIGGTKGQMEDILISCYDKLANDGIIVLSVVLMESVSSAIEILKKMNLDYDVQLIQISRSKSIANSKRYDALNPIHLFTIQKKV